jgi:hypothetical protein
MILLFANDWFVTKLMVDIVFAGSVRGYDKEKTTTKYVLER